MTSKTAAVMGEHDVAMHSGNDEASMSSQSSAMSLCLSDTTPALQSTSSQKSTCLKRTKKSRSGVCESGDFNWLEGSSQEQEPDIVQRLNFDGIELSDDSDEEVEKKTASAKKRRVNAAPAKGRSSLPKTPRGGSATKSKPASVSVPVRNTCILESPLDRRKSTRKNRVYGVRRNEPQLPRKRPKRCVKRPIPFALCALQRMFAE